MPPDPDLLRSLDLGIALVTVLLMLGVGLGLRPRAIAGSLERSSSLWGQLALVVVLPVLAGLATVALLRPPPAVASALLLVAFCPVGDIANAYTLLARGDTARSLLLNALSALLAPLTMSAGFALVAAFGSFELLQAPPALPLFRKLLLFLVLPVAAGMALRTRAPGLAGRLNRPVHGATSAGILCLLALVLVHPGLRPAHWGSPLLAGSTFLLMSLGFSALLLRLGRAARGDSVAAALCLPVRNVGVAALVAAGLLDRPEWLSTLGVYFVVEVPMLLAASLVLRRRAGPQPV